jgi:hypothetical protein
MTGENPQHQEHMGSAKYQRRGALMRASPVSADREIAAYAIS